MTDLYPLFEQLPLPGSGPQRIAAFSGTPVPCSYYPIEDGDRFIIPSHGCKTTTLRQQDIGTFPLFYRVIPALIVHLRYPYNSEADHLQ